MAKDSAVDNPGSSNFIALLFWLPILFVFSLGFVLLKSQFDLAVELEPLLQTKPDYPFPCVADLKLFLVFIVVLTTFRLVLCPTAFYNLGNWFLPSLKEKPSWTASSREDRLQRFSIVTFKFLFFLVSTAFGWIILKDTDYLPPVMGGKTGNIVSNSWIGSPFQPIPAGLKEYYMFGAAYHTHSLIFHLCTKRRNDFLEMVLHHLSAVYLIFFSFFMNIMRYGALVLFLHDVPDVFVYLCKMVVDSKHKYFTLLSYFGLLSSWGYMRLFVYPFYVSYSLYFESDSFLGSSYAASLNCLKFMVATLQVLHIYWYTLFLKMGMDFLKTGVTKDTQQIVGVDLDKKSGHLQQQPAGDARPRKSKSQKAE